MASKNPVNIFETLRGNESSDDESMQVVKQRDPTQKRIRPKKNKNPAEAVGATSTHEPVEQAKEDAKRTKYAKDGKPDRKVSSEPHPKDRQSGTGRGREMRKGGQGKSNWGTYKDDEREEQAYNDETKPVEEEEVDDSMTLTELLKQRQVRSQ